MALGDAFKDVVATGQKTASTASANLAQTQSVVEAIGAQFPELLNYLQIPDVFNLLVQATNDPAGQWTGTRFAVALQGTNWWQQTPPSARKWQATKLSDPARAAQLEGQSSQSIRQVAAQMGVPLTNNQLNWLTEVSLGQGWDANEIQRQVVDIGRNEKLKPGMITATKSALGQVAGNYALPISDHTLHDWAIKVNDGSATTQGFEEFARSQAKAAFPSLQKELEAGMTVRQLADPYMQIAGDLLGRDAAQFNLRDPKWTRALQSRDPKSGNIVGPMTHLDWQRTVMTDKAYNWDQSANAHQAANTLKEHLAETFGLGKF